MSVVTTPVEATIEGATMRATRIHDFKTTEVATAPKITASKSTTEPTVETVEHLTTCSKVTTDVLTTKSTNATTQQTSICITKQIDMDRAAVSFRKQLNFLRSVVVGKRVKLENFFTTQALRLVPLDNKYNLIIMFKTYWLIFLKEPNNLSCSYDYTTCKCVANENAEFEMQKCSVKRLRGDDECCHCESEGT